MKLVSDGYYFVIFLIGLLVEGWMFIVFNEYCVLFWVYYGNSDFGVFVVDVVGKVCDIYGFVIVFEYGVNYEGLVMGCGIDYVYLYIVLFDGIDVWDLDLFGVMFYLMDIVDIV